MDNEPPITPEKLLYAIFGKHDDYCEIELNGWGVCACAERAA